MNIEVSPLSIVLFAGILSAVGSLLWAAGRSLLNQYGDLLRDQLAEHRNESNLRHGQIVSRLDSMEVALDADTARIARLENVAETAPSHNDLAKVYESVNNLSATVNQLVGESRGQSDSLRLILNRITEKGMGK
ncbi:hypothetical protein [Azonexus sp.]|uniref:hypothetical protein n=1 Tax=Azonexus sp. TaxID=1872668 RepID=UPI0039E2E430